MSTVAATAASAGVPAKAGSLRDYVTLVKPRIMIMALLTAAGGMSLAPGKLDTVTFIWLLVGTAMIVGSANALNMYLERDIDCLMARTKHRPLPQKRMAPGYALVFGLTLGVLSLPTLFMAGLATALFGAVALFSYVLLYTPLKQRTHWATWIGALPGALPVLMGWAAGTNRVDTAGLIVFGVLFIWQVPHFHAIAMYRQREYENAGLKTLPGERGVAAAKREIVGYLFVQVALSLALFATGIVGIPYLVVASVLGAMVLVQCLAGVANGDAKWARGVFLASIVYLPVLFCTMVANGG